MVPVLPLTSVPTSAPERVPSTGVVSVVMSVKVDGVDGQRLSWDPDFSDPQTEAFQQLAWEARNAVSATHSRCILKSHAGHMHTILMLFSYCGDINNSALYHSKWSIVKAAAAATFLLLQDNNMRVMH